MKKEEFIKKVLKIKKENKDDYKKIIDKINVLRQVKSFICLFFFLS